jgi:AcrR family transcriptional regulator
VGPRLRVRLSKAERRAALLAAAAKVFRRHGYQFATVTHVVRQARVSRGTFYEHFDSKRRLLGALAGELLDRVLPRFPRIPPVTTRGELEAALAAMNRLAFDAVAREPVVARLVLGGGLGSEPAAVRLLAAHDAGWVRLTQSLLQRARAAKAIRDGLDLAFAAEAIVAASQRTARAIAAGTARGVPALLATRLAELQAATVAR